LPHGAIDLKQRFTEVTVWLDGGKVYDLLSATYPPASFVMLWPFVGWGSFTVVRWLWGVSSLILIVVLIWQVWHLAQPRDRLEKVFFAAFVISLLSLRVTVGNGQLGLHIIVVLLPALLLLRRPNPSLLTDLTIASLMTLALVKLTFSAPFMWIIVLLTRRVRVTVFTVILYAILTLIADFVHPMSLIELIGAWLRSAGRTLSVDLGYANIHYLLRSMSASQWNSIASIILLVLLGIWLWRFGNHETYWIAVGLTGVFCRMWTYHNVYDDILIVPAMLAFWQLARQRKSPYNVLAGLMFVAFWLTATDFTGSGIHKAVPYWQFMIGLVWLAGMIYLGWEMYQRTSLRLAKETG
jgi:hypothetical protein